MQSRFPEQARLYRRFQFALASVLAVLVCLAAPAASQELAFQLDRTHSHVDFSLDSVLHTVHGDFRLKDGSLRFDPQTGAASGELTVDATTGESGNQGRDRKMHQQVLESAKYPAITFQPQRVIGELAPAGVAQMQVEGLLTIHGQSHPVTASGPVQVNDGEIAAELRFVIPYQRWGMKNPSTLFLRVSDKVEITVHAVGRLAPAPTPATAQSGAAH